MVAIVTALKTANTIRKFVKFMKTRYRKNLESTLTETHKDLKAIRKGWNRMSDAAAVRKIQSVINRIERIKELELKEEIYDDERH